MFIVGFGASVIAKPEKSCRAIPLLGKKVCKREINVFFFFLEMERNWEGYKKSGNFLGVCLSSILN